MSLMNLYGIDVNVSDFAMEKILTSGQEGVRYPQALAEIFSSYLGNVIKDKGFDILINIDCESKKKVFPSTPGEEELVIVTRFNLVNRDGSPVQGAPETYWLYTNYADLCQVRYKDRSYGFNAANVAKEYASMFGQYYRDVLL